MAKQSKQQVEQNKQQTLELLAQYREKPSQRLRDRIFALNLPLVHQIANRFLKSTDAELDDLCQVGGVGLIKAIDGFDLSLGNAFSSYACDKIKGELMHYRRDKCSSGGLRLGRAVIEKGPKMQRLLEMGYTVAQVAEASGFSVSEVREILQALRHRKVSSLDAYRSDDGEEIGLEVASYDDRSDHWCRVAESMGIPIQRRNDGLINATAICKASGKKFKVYWQQQRTKKYLRNFPKRSASLTLYQIRRGKNGGAWLSDSLAIDLIRWADPRVGMMIDTFAANSVIESA